MMAGEGEPRKKVKRGGKRGKGRGRFNKAFTWGLMFNLPSKGVAEDPRHCKKRGTEEDPQLCLGQKYGPLVFGQHTGNYWQKKGGLQPSKGRGE